MYYRHSCQAKYYAMIRTNTSNNKSIGQSNLRTWKCENGISFINHEFIRQVAKKMPAMAPDEVEVMFIVIYFCFADLEYIKLC